MASTYGVWTQHAQILCPTCARAIGQGIQFEQTHENSEGQCEHCGKPIVLNLSLAQEQHLMYEARQQGYPESHMVQAGGMTHNCTISFKDFHGDWWYMSCYCLENNNSIEWTTEIADCHGEVVSYRDAMDVHEILQNVYWMQRNCMALPSTEY